MGDCIDNEGHDFEFIGYMVVSGKLPEEPVTIPITITGSTMSWSGPMFPVPTYFPAKIEVHQCTKCGEIKLQQAVFSRILEGDKNE